MTGKFPSIDDSEIIEASSEHFDKAIQMLRSERNKIKDSDSCSSIMCVQIDKILQNALLGAGLSEMDPQEAKHKFSKLLHHTNRIDLNDRDDAWNSKHAEYSYYAALAAARGKDYDEVKVRVLKLFIPECIKILDSLNFYCSNNIFIII